MADTLSFELVTPLKVFKGEGVKEITLTAETGELGIFPGHDVMILSLGTGPMNVFYQDKNETYFVSRGYIQIDHDNVRVLAEICEEKTEIDADRAAQAKERAEKRLKEGVDRVDWARAESSLKRAIERLQIIGK